MKVESIPQFPLTFLRKYGIIFKKEEMMNFAKKGQNTSNRWQKSKYF